MADGLIDNVISLGHEVLATGLRAHGSPCFVVDIDRFRESAQAFSDELMCRYPNSRLAYSVKTNRLSALLHAAMEKRLFAEVVSDVEYDLVRRCGFQDVDIIFNGPVKRATSLRRAIDGGAMVNVDSVDELSVVAAIAGHRPTTTEIGLRCRLPDSLTPGSRFGIDTDKRSLGHAVQMAAATGVRVVGLHNHYPGDRSPAQYRARVEALIELAVQHLDVAKIRYLNIGGGMTGPMSDVLRARRGSPAWKYEDYARSVAEPMAAAFPHAAPTLILEPGTGLLADVGAYLCEVVAIKRPPGRRPVAVVTGTSLHLDPFRTGFRLPLRIVRDGRSASDGVCATDVVGSTCMEDDHLATEYDESIRVGDIVVVENVGAYSMSLNSRFIWAEPTVVAFDRDRGLTSVLRRPTRPDEALELELRSD